MPAGRQVMAKQISRDKAQPFSIRLTTAERAVLEDKAAGVPLGTFIRSIILDEKTKGRAGPRQYPIKDGAALGQVLGFLGRSRLSNNLNQLAKAANLGSLPVTQELEAELRTACASITLMRDQLLLALGKSISSPCSALSSTFKDAASESEASS